jgi:P21-Rho-binding domain
LSGSFLAKDRVSESHVNIIQLVFQTSTAIVAEPPVRPKSILRRMGNALSRAFTSPEETQEAPNFEISEPYNFQHVRHVQLDPRTSTGFSVSLRNKNMLLSSIFKRVISICRVYPHRCAQC